MNRILVPLLCNSCSSLRPDQITGHLVFQYIHDYLGTLPNDYDSQDMWPCWMTNNHDREIMFDKLGTWKSMKHVQGTVLCALF